MVHFVWYIGMLVLVVMGARAAFQSSVFETSTPSVLIFFVTIFVLFFALFSAVVLRILNTGGVKRFAFFLTHAAALLIGFGILPLRLHETLLNNEGFFLFSPTAPPSLFVAALTAFACYAVFILLVRKIFERMYRDLFQPRNGPGRITVAIAVICGIAMLFLAVIIMLFSDPLFIFTIVFAPFMRFAVLVLSGEFMIFGLILSALFILSFPLMLEISIDKERIKHQQILFYSLIRHSKVLAGIHLVAWFFYMEAYGAVFQLGSLDPFPFLP